MRRRELLQLSITGAASAAFAQGETAKKPGPPPPFEHAGKGVKALQAAMKDGSLTSAKLVVAYQQRIEALNPELHAILELNPDALPAAEALDKERKESKARSPLHGIPIVLKDNVETGDKMQTTAGSMALMGTPAKNDAFVVKKLRDAGAVILAKANLSEWANIRSPRATSGWSARGGQGRNPYALDRSPIGSSSGSGIAVAADLCTLALGTETDGSIVCPASAMSLVGIKPTVGLLSRSGIVPISATQDTAGPMARTVEDAALMLTAMVATDPDDRATGVPGRKVVEDYAKGLDLEALRNTRIGVARQFFGKGPGVTKVLTQALKDLEKAGATLVDVTLEKAPDDELELLLHELKDGMATYLKKRRPDAQVKTLADIIAFNAKNSDRELPFFGQELFEKADKLGPLTSQPYRKALEACRKATKAMDAVIAKNKLTAIVTGTMEPAWLIDPVLGDTPTAFGTGPAAVAGYPSITVPAGEVSGLPIGLLFFGPAWSEHQLIKLAHAYEKSTSHRRPPTFPATATPKF